MSDNDKCPLCDGSGWIDTGGQNPDGSWIRDSCPYCTLRRQLAQERERSAEVLRCWQEGIGSLSNPWRRRMAELVGDLPHIDKEDDLDFDMAERVERAEAACAAKDAEIARLRDRTIRVCKCGCLVIGRLDHPCDKCASLDGTLIEVAWFDAKRELARLREALRHIANRLKDGGEWSYDHLCSLSEYATRAAAEDAKEKP